METFIMDTTAFPAASTLRSKISSNRYWQRRLKDLNELYTLSKELTYSQSLDKQLDRIVKDTVRLTKACFGRILTLESNGSFLCRAVYQKAAFIDATNRPFHAHSQFLHTIMGQTPHFIHKDDLQVNVKDIHALGLEDVSGLWMVPLYGGSEILGYLVLGDDLKDGHDQVSSHKMEMINGIAELAATTIQRARVSERLEAQYLKTVLLLAKRIDPKDPNTGRHGFRTAAYVKALAISMGCNEEETRLIRWAGLLHDVGKIGVPEEILEKPSKLNAAEWEIMMTHPLIGVEILKPLPKLAGVLPIIAAHHEKFNGHGYPYGLSGSAIPIGARILAVADAFSAMTESRVYHPAFSPEEAVLELKRCSGSHFDPEVVTHFLKLLYNGEID